MWLVRAMGHIPTKRLVGTLKSEGLNVTVGVAGVAPLTCAYHRRRPCRLLRIPWGLLRIFTDRLPKELVSYRNQAGCVTRRHAARGICADSVQCACEMYG